MNIRDRRRNRQDVSKFKALIVAPVEGAVTLPANARITFQSVNGAVAGTVAGTIIGPSNRTIKTAILNEGNKTIICRVGRASVVTPAAGFRLLVDIGLNVFRRIAEGAVVFVVDETGNNIADEHGNLLVS